MRYQHLARFPDIGCNSCLLEIGGVRIVVDAGAHPKHVGAHTLPLLEALPRNSVDAVIVTHAHLDHLGGLPCLMNDQRDASVIMTQLTKEFGSALLHNSVNVMKAQKVEFNCDEYPLFHHRQVDRCARDWHSREAGETFHLGDEREIACRFYSAGHVSGAVGVHFEHNGRSLFYTGDVHFEDQTLTLGAQFPQGKVNTLIIETTRGASPRRPHYNREEEKLHFGQKIAETLDRGGAVLIPVFAFGKTQEVLLMLHELREEGVIPVVPVHIGGLSTRMTEITDQHAESPVRGHRHFQLLRDFEQLRVLPKGQKQPESHPGHIYALSSGMMSEHTVSNRFGRRHVRKEENSLLFVGYVDEDTPAGRILRAGQGQSVLLDDEDDFPVDVRCEVERFDFSGHSTREQLADYAVSCQPDQVILVHGDPDAKAWFEAELSRRLPGSRVIVPSPGQRVDL